MGSDENHFNVSWGAKSQDIVHKPQLLKRKHGIDDDVHFKWKIPCPPFSRRRPHEQRHGHTHYTTVAFWSVCLCITCLSLEKGSTPKMCPCFVLIFKNWISEKSFFFFRLKCRENVFFQSGTWLVSPLCLVGEDERAAGDAETRACQAEGFRQQYAGPSPGATGGHVRGQQADRGQVPQHQRDHEEKGNVSSIFFFPLALGTC